MYRMETLLRKSGLPYLKKELVCEEEKHVDEPKAVWKLLNTYFSLGKQTEEKVYMLAMDTKSKVIGTFEISHGIINQSFCNPREILMKALLCNANRIILAHNHPSGDITPSMEDLRSWKRIKEASALIGIEALDSIIVSQTEYCSLSEYNNK